MPFEIQLKNNILKLSPGDSISSHFIVSPQNENQFVDISSIVSTTHDFLDVELTIDDTVIQYIEISASDDALPGTYKILLGGQTSDIAISKYLTVIVE